MGITRVNTNVNSKLRALISYWLTGMWTVVNLKLRQQAVAIHMDLYIYTHTFTCEYSETKVLPI